MLLRRGFMRLDNGMRFDRCIGLQDRSYLDGAIFDANVLNCHDKPLRSGECIRVGGRANLYEGDDSLGNSHFSPLEPFPEFERIEKPYKDLFIVLEIYPMKNGHFYVWPYVQNHPTSSGNYTRRAFGLAREFETREAAEQAGWQAGEKEIDEYYSPRIGT
jgi:hypothetical protein